MKQRKCPYHKDSCWDYGSCEDCHWNILIEKYERKIKRLKSKLEVATVKLAEQKDEGAEQ